jgi:hypothetical protein
VLFDLRGRGRRRVVQVVYLGLALLIGGGLILFGVGTGSGGGGLLGAFTGGGSGGNSNQVVSAQVKAAERQTRQDPSNPAAWSALVSAQWQSASSTGYNSTTGTYNSTGQKDLAAAAQAWQHYAALTKHPDPDVAILAARAYEHLGQYANAANAWQAITTVNTNQINAFACLAANSYAAKQTRVGTLAEAKTLSLAPKADRTQLKSEISEAETQPSVVLSIC